jgi:hypothetical protein
MQKIIIIPFAARRRKDSNRKSIAVEDIARTAPNGGREKLKLPARGFQAHAIYVSEKYRGSLCLCYMPGDKEESEYNALPHEEA